MRRRGRPVSHDAQPRSTNDNAAAYPEPRPLVISEVPELWRRHAREPWRILFPDMTWTPPELE